MLTIVTGPPAGGKSTHVQTHARPGDLVVDLDEIASALTAGGSGHEHGHLVWRAAQRARAAVVEEALRQGGGQAVWIIHTDPDQDAMARYGDHDARVVVCDPGRDEVARRIAAERPASAQAVADRWYASRPEDQRDGRAQSAGSTTPSGGRVTEISPTPQGGNPTPTGAEKTFTQADVERIIGERLAREREKFADYDQLKAKAAEADSSKTELQKLAERVEASEKRASDAEAKQVRAEVASAKGLTAEQAKRLTGTSKEELESDADDLLKAFGGKKDEPKPNDEPGQAAKDEPKDDEPSFFGRPKERLTPGASSDAEPEKTPDQIADEVIKQTRGL